MKFYHFSSHCIHHCSILNCINLYYPNESAITNALIVRQSKDYAEIWNKKQTPLLCSGFSYMTVGVGNLPTGSTATYINGCKLWINGSTVIGSSLTDTSSSLTIGGAKLSWDNNVKALCVTGADGQSANFYATGGVSALGFSSGVNSVDAMTFNRLTVSSTASISTANISSLNVSSSLKIGSSATLDVNDILAIEYDNDVDGLKFYFDDTRYIYVDNGTLKYYNGTTDKTINVS